MRENWYKHFEIRLKLQNNIESMHNLWHRNPTVLFHHRSKKSVGRKLETKIIR